MKYFNQLKKIYLALIIGVFTFLAMNVNVFAASYTAKWKGFKTGGEYKWYVDTSSKDGKNTMKNTGAGLFSMSDGNTAFCIEPGTHSSFKANAYTRKTLNASNLKEAGIKDEATFAKLQRIAYYGYGYNGDTAQATYLATQLLIWNVQGNASVSAGATSTNNVTKKMTTIENRIANATKTPNFDTKKKIVPVGESAIFTDADNILSNFEVATCDGCEAEIQDNNLIVTSNKIGTATVTLKRKEEGTNSLATHNYLYTAGTYQKLAVLGRPDPVMANINVEFKGAIIKPYKRDIETNDKTQGDATFEGATYELRDSEDQVIETLVADKTGALNSQIELNVGTYTLRETKAPEGYLLSDKVYTIEVTKENIGQEISIDVFDTVIKSKVLIEKTYGSEYEGYQPELGAVFEVLNSKNEVVMTITTEEKGLGIITLPYGEYTLRQIVSAEGYVKQDDIKFSVTEDSKIFQFELVNLKLGKVIITKTDISGSEPVEGATIQVYLVKDNGDEEKVYEGKTDKDGRLYVENLEKGNYYFIETEAPEGYILNTDKHEFSVTEYGVLYEKSFTNEETSIEIEKRAFEDDALLSGAEICVYKEDGSLFACGITNESGVVRFTKLPYGKYYYQETKAPTGYKLDDTKYEFEVEEGNATLTATLYNRYRLVLASNTGSYNTDLYLAGILFIGAIVCATCYFIIKRKQ